MKNTQKLNILIGNLKTLIIKGEDPIFVDHHIVKFLDGIDIVLYNRDAEEAMYRLNNLVHQLVNFKTEINYSVFHVMFLNRGFKMLEPLIKRGMMPAPNPLSIYGQQPSL